MRCRRLRDQAVRGARTAGAYPQRAAPHERPAGGERPHGEYAKNAHDISWLRVRRGTLLRPLGGGRGNRADDKRMPFTESPLTECKYGAKPRSIVGSGAAAEMG